MIRHLEGHSDPLVDLGAPGYENRRSSTDTMKGSFRTTSPSPIDPARVEYDTPAELVRASERDLPERGSPRRRGVGVIGPLARQWYDGLMATLDDEIRDAVAAIPGIAALLIFGSRARGTHRPDSDLDIAVLPTADGAIDPKANGLLKDLRIRLAVALAHLAPGGRVDVVRLDLAPDTLRQRVMVEGRMIVCHDLAAWKALRVATMKEYGDREWARKIYQRALVKRLSGGSPSGRSLDRRQPA